MSDLHKTQIRQPGPLAWMPVVLPSGKIRHSRYGPGVHGGMIDYDAKRGIGNLRPDLRERGYILLREAYEADPREEVREHGLKEYYAHHKAVHFGRAGREKLNSLDPKQVRTKPKDFPEDLLPEAVIKRRNGEGPNGPQWEPSITLKKPTTRSKSKAAGDSDG